jgi:hypothetical protein
MNISLCNIETVAVGFGQFCWVKYYLFKELHNFKVLLDKVYTNSLSLYCSTLKMEKVRLLEWTVTLPVAAAEHHRRLASENGRALTGLEIGATGKWI